MNFSEAQAVLESYREAEQLKQTKIVNHVLDPWEEDITYSSTKFKEYFTVVLQTADVVVVTHKEDISNANYLFFSHKVKSAFGKDSPDTFGGYISYPTYTLIKELIIFPNDFTKITYNLSKFGMAMWDLII